jgi:hypothetical protein
MKDWKVGDPARHIPTGLVGRVLWLPIQQDLPFMYIDVDNSLDIRQGQVHEFERVEDDDAQVSQAAS